MNRIRKSRPRRRRETPRLEAMEARVLLSAAPYEVGFELVDDWGGGFTANMSITNNSGSDLNDWRLGFDLETSISSIWDARFLDPSEPSFEVAGAAWNPDLKDGETVTFGFVGGAGDREPSGFTINGQPIDGGGGGDSGGLPSLGIEDTSTSEGNIAPSALSFNVRLSSASDETVTVAYEVVDGTATGGEDHEGVGGALTFEPGETEQYVIIPVIPDTDPEANETVFVELRDPVNARLGDGQAVGTILNDDGAPPAENAPAKPTLSLNDADPSDGAFTVGFNIWSGTNATYWQLFENGVEVHAEELTDNSPNPQSASVELTGRFHAANVYEVVLGNDAGSTSSDPLTHIVGGASRIRIDGADGAEQVAQVTVDQGATTFDLDTLGVEGSTYQAWTNNPDVISASVDGSTLTIEGLEAGRASVKLADLESGEERFVGVRVRTEEGALPGLPNYVAIGSVSEDSSADLGFWRDFENPATNKRMDVRYIYLNGGPENGWRTWQNGQRLQSFIRESQKLGMVPYFVWYNIPDSAESYQSNLEHIQDPEYMRGYFEDLKYALETIQEMAGDETVGFVLEPDFLGYMMQIGRDPADQVMARTDAAYQAGALDPNVDPVFDNTVQGLVQSINYTISTRAPNVRFGWQFNLWASPGIHTSIPRTGLMHLTDTMGIEAGRQAIAAEAAEIADYYINAGVTSHGAEFLAIDKFGLDAVGFESTAANDPASSTWFWNADHWMNYLEFSRVLHEKTDLPVTLWQIPVGHINTSLAENPYDPSGVFPDLANSVTQYEDSAGTFFLGDTFQTTGARRDFFGQNLGGDANVSLSGDTITWGSHIAEAAEAGIDTILFGAGVGASTDGVGSPPTDSFWWISQAQDYFEDPVPLDGSGSGGDEDGGDETPPAASLRITDATVNESDGEATMTVSLSRAMETPVTVDYGTEDGTAVAGDDFSAASGTLTFAPGETSQQIRISLIDDALTESKESFRVRLSGADGASLADATGVVTIRDDDGESGDVAISFNVDSDWGSGFGGSIRIRNQAGVPLEAWGLEFDFDGRISSIWEADIAERDGTRYRLVPKSYNGTIPAGGELTIGFVGSRAHSGIEPTNYLFTHNG